MIEDVGRQAMGFIDNEQEIAPLAGQIGEGGAELRQEAVRSRPVLLEGPVKFECRGWSP